MSSSEISSSVFFSNRVASEVYNFGMGLLSPGKKCLEFGFQIIKPLYLGEKGHSASLPCEIARRVQLVLGAIILTPFAIATAPIGIGLCSLAAFAKKSIVVLSTNTQNSSPNLPKSLSFLSFNVALLPKFVTDRNNVHPTAQRVDSVVQEILRRNEDVVCLQEAFDEQAVIRIANKVKQIYPYEILQAGYKNFTLSSGLVVLSKYPIEDCTFWEHEKLDGYDRWANKGLLGLKIRLSDEKVVFVFNTHLNAEAADGGVSSRKVQLDAIRKKIPEYLQKQLLDQKMWAGTFVIGDFNIGPIQEGNDNEINPEWEDHKDFFRGDFTEDYEGDGPDYTNESPINNSKRGTAFDMEDRNTGWDYSRVPSWRVKEECIDHILHDPKNSQYQNENYCRDPMGGSSDHLAVAAKFTLS